MQFSYILALASAVAVVAAAPQVTAPTPACSTGTPQCCNTSHSETNAKDILALLGLDQITGAIGLNCLPLPINAVGGSVAVQNQCKGVPTCCTGNQFNGLVQIGCTPLSVN